MQYLKECGNGAEPPPSKKNIKKFERQLKAK